MEHTLEMCEILNNHCDICPQTGELDCSMCSGEYCSIHFDKPCDCDVVERHSNHVNVEEDSNE